MQCCRQPQTVRQIVACENGEKEHLRCPIHRGSLAQTEVRWRQFHASLLRRSLVSQALGFLTFQVLITPTPQNTLQSGQSATPPQGFATKSKVRSPIDGGLSMRVRLVAMCTPCASDLECRASARLGLASRHHGYFMYVCIIAEYHQHWVRGTASHNHGWPGLKPNGPFNRPRLVFFLVNCGQPPVFRPAQTSGRCGFPAF